MNDSADHARTIAIPNYATAPYGSEPRPFHPSYKGWLREADPTVVHALLLELVRATQAHVDSPYRRDQATDQYNQAQLFAEMVVHRAIGLWSDWAGLSLQQRRNRWDQFEDAMRAWRREDARELPVTYWSKPGPYSSLGDGIEELPERHSKKLTVYFIGSLDGPIKIGITSSLTARLATIQTGSAVRLDVLASCDGDGQLEIDYHARFAAHRLHGEWFERHPDILAEIDRLNALALAQTRGR